MLKNTLAAAIALALLAIAYAAPAHPRRPAPSTWTPDNGNGTFTNPLFYDEFSDPDLIRVGDDFYLTGTTMHAMPGLPMLHSKDLVNWEFMAYALDKLDLGPAYPARGRQGHLRPGHLGAELPLPQRHVPHLQQRQRPDDAASSRPPIRAGRGRARDEARLHDLSVLFDDDGKAYVVWGHQDMHLAQLDDDADRHRAGHRARDVRARTPAWAKARISTRSTASTTSSAPGTRAACACRPRAPIALEGPYEVNQAISADEDFGLRQGNRLRGNGNAADRRSTRRTRPPRATCRRCTRAASCRRRPASGGASR